EVVSFRVQCEINDLRILATFLQKVVAESFFLLGQVNGIMNVFIDVQDRVLSRIGLTDHHQFGSHAPALIKILSDKAHRRYARNACIKEDKGYTALFELFKKRQRFMVKDWRNDNSVRLC